MRKWTKWRRTTRTTRTTTQVIPWSLADGRRQKEEVLGLEHVVCFKSYLGLKIESDEVVGAVQTHRLLYWSNVIFVDSRSMRTQKLADNQIKVDFQNYFDQLPRKADLLEKSISLICEILSTSFWVDEFSSEKQGSQPSLKLLSD